MPPIEQDGLIHKAVYWEATDTFDEFANPIRMPAVEIDVRWRVRRRQSVDANANPVAIEATVITPYLLPLDSLLWKGTLAEWNAEHGSDDTDNEVMIVASNGVTEDIDGKEVKYSVNLSRYRETKPS